MYFLNFSDFLLKINLWLLLQTRDAKIISCFKVLRFKQKNSKTIVSSHDWQNTDKVGIRLPFTYKRNRSPPLCRKFNGHDLKHKYSTAHENFPKLRHVCLPALQPPSSSTMVNLNKTLARPPIVQLYLEVGGSPFSYSLIQRTGCRSVRKLMFLSRIMMAADEHVFCLYRSRFVKKVRSVSRGPREPHRRFYCATLPHKTLPRNATRSSQFVV